VDIIRLLQQRGTVVVYHDPFVPQVKEDTVDLRSVPLTPEQLEAADCAIIVTDHSTVDYALLARHVRVIVDTRHVLPAASPAGAPAPAPASRAARRAPA